MVAPKQVEQIAEEDRMPTGQVHQERGRRRGFWDGFRCGFQKHGGWFHQLGRSLAKPDYSLTNNVGPDVLVWVGERSFERIRTLRAGKRTRGASLRRTAGHPSLHGSDGSFPCFNKYMSGLARMIPVMLLVGTFLGAQTPTPSAPATKPAEDYSGMYSFLQDGEFVQLTIEDTNRVSGFISRYGDLESDQGSVQGLALVPYQQEK